MFDFSIMSQEDYHFSDLDFLLSKDNITEDDLLQFPEVPLKEPKTPSNHTSISHELESLSLTPTDKPTIALNIRPRKPKSTTPSRQLFHKQMKSEEATSKYTATQNPQFQFNLAYKIKENINQWRIVFWDSKRQEFTLENPSLNYQRLSVRLRSISAFC